MSYVIKVSDGVVVGMPKPRPATVMLDSGHEVGCSHWSNAELIETAGLYPVTNGYDPALHVATGGGELVNGGVAAAYAERPIEPVRDEVIAAVIAELERRTSAIFGMWPQHERDTFEQQYTEATAYLADLSVATPLLDSLKLPNEDKQILAQAVVEHASAFKRTMGAMLGAKRMHLEAIWRKGTVAELRAYDVTAGWPS